MLKFFTKTFFATKPIKTANKNMGDSANKFAKKHCMESIKDHPMKIHLKQQQNIPKFRFDNLDKNSPLKSEKINLKTVQNDNFIKNMHLSSYIPFYGLFVEARNYFRGDRENVYIPMLKKLNENKNQLNDEDLKKLDEYNKWFSDDGKTPSVKTGNFWFGLPLKLFAVSGMTYLGSGFFSKMSVYFKVPFFGLLFSGLFFDTFIAYLNESFYKSVKGLQEMYARIIS